MSDQDKQPTSQPPTPEQGSSAPSPAEPSPPEAVQPANVPPAPPQPPKPEPDKPGRETLVFNRGTSSGKPAGITCPKCGHANRPGILVCENCGTLLINEEQPSGTKRFEGEPQESDADPKRNISTETMEMLSVAVSTAGGTTFTENMVLRLEIDGAPAPVLLSPKYETSLGRRDPATGTMPDVDLSAYAGYRLGVSRKHAIIRLKDKQLELYDLGSSNGTMVNGVRLTPHQPHVLRDGDEITLGKMIVRVLFQIKNRRK